MDEFARNIGEKPPPVHRVQRAELDGLPADFIARHKPDANGVITLTTTVDQRPVLTYAKSEDLRQRMLLAVGNIAAPENIAVLRASCACASSWRGCSATRTGRPTTWRRAWPAT